MAPLVPLKLSTPFLTAPATRSVPLPGTPIIAARQATTTVVVQSGGGGGSSTLSGGAIAGIVIGSVFGLILIIWLARWASGAQINGEAYPSSSHRHRGGYYYTQEKPRRHSHSHSHRRGRSVEVRSYSTVAEPAKVYVPTTDVRYSSRGRSSRR
ncbi:hypothetical protein NKR23_g6849 [Pleurostoma richardsiae]|uniref:Transmembrane protein n=1 Tax=Pleurostoma richardsiae TaxID=41990 RepID=A0AA38RBZ2_9PEZI|nr:hypothetical protein NKR23_g6849 [Pleurostoma richardsiae]